MFRLPFNKCQSHAIRAVNKKTILGISANGQRGNKCFVVGPTQRRSFFHRSAPAAAGSTHIPNDARIGIRSRSNAFSFARRFSSGGDGKQTNGDSSAEDEEEGGGSDRSEFKYEVKIRMPEVGEDQEGVIEKWYKEEGDLIKNGDTICDIKTEMFTFGMVTDDDDESIMGEIMIAENSDPFADGTVICTTFHKTDPNE